MNIINPSHYRPCCALASKLFSRIAVIATFAFAIVTLSSQAASLTVPNFSFESPIVIPGYPVDTRIDNWQKTPQPAWYNPAVFGGILWDQLTGVFPNPDPTNYNHIANMTGNQGLYMFSFPSVGVFQDYRSTDHAHSSPMNAFNETFEIGKSYQLTVGVLGGETLPEGDILQLSLYYRDAADNRVTIASTPIVYSTSLFTSKTNFLDFQVNLAEVQATDAWAGQHIGIEFNALYGSSFGTYWDLDNVRLTSAVPEPGSAAFLAVGLAALALRRRHKG